MAPFSLGRPTIKSPYCRFVLRDSSEFLHWGESRKVVKRGFANQAVRWPGDGLAQGRIPKAASCLQIFEGLSCTAKEKVGLLFIS